MDQQTVPVLQIPGITRLRREGTTMSAAYSNCPICVPARFTWLHGLYPSQGAAPLMGNAGNWPTDLPTFAQALQLNGYHTALLGKLHAHTGIHHHDLVAGEQETRKRGFHDVMEVAGKSLTYWHDCHWTRHLRQQGVLDRYRESLRHACPEIGDESHIAQSFLSAENHVDGFIGAKAAAWLTAYDDPRPFFLHASFCSPHYPLDPSPEFDLYQPEDMPVPIGLTDANEIAEWQRRRALYCGLITQVDAEINRLLNIIDEKELAENTLVVFTTDHGDMIGDHGLNNKGVPQEASCRTPMTLRFPGTIPAGAECSAPLETADLPVTLLAAAGLKNITSEWLPDSPGRSFWDYCRHQGEAPRQWCYAERGWQGEGWRMVRDERYKYVWSADSDDQLFDLQEDPRETMNIAPQQAALVSLMRERMLQSTFLAPAPRRGSVDAGTYCRWDL